MGTVTGRSTLPSIGARGAARVSLVGTLAAALSACGGVTGGRVDPGYPAARPHVVAATALQPRLSGEVVRFAVPVGWGLAHLAAERNTPRAFVHLDGDCYESVSITGSSTRALTTGGIDALYANPVAGYSWSVATVGPVILAVLSQRNATTGALSRSALGTAYVPTAPGTYLAIDFGAGVWPLGGRACPDSDVSARLSRLDGAVTTIFASVRLGPAAPAPSTPAAPGAFPPAAGIVPTSARLP